MNSLNIIILIVKDMIKSDKKNYGNNLLLKINI